MVYFTGITQNSNSCQLLKREKQHKFMWFYTFLIGYLIFILGNYGKDDFFLIHYTSIALYFFTLYISLSIPKKRNTPSYLKKFYWYPLVGCLIMVLAILVKLGFLTFRLVDCINDISVFFHFVFLGRFIYVVSNKMKIQKIIGLCVLGAMLFFVFYNISNYFNLATSMSSIGLFILCIIYFYQLLNSSLNLKLLIDPSFIICCGIFMGSGILIISSWIHKYFQIYKIDSNVESSFAAVATLGYLIIYISIITAFLRLPSKN